MCATVGYLGEWAGRRAEQSLRQIAAGREVGHGSVQIGWQQSARAPSLCRAQHGLAEELLYIRGLALAVGGAGGTFAYGDTATGVAFGLTKNRLAADFTTATHVSQIVTRAVADS